MTTEDAAKHLVNAARMRGLTTIGKAVKLLVEAHKSRKLAAVGDLVLTTEKDAYRVQDEVFAKLWPGARANAWKAGGPSDQVVPTVSPIAAEKLLRSPAKVAAKDMNMVGVEAEIAFRLCADLPPRVKSYSEKEVTAAVGEVLVAIEICDTRLADYKATSGLWKLADFQTNWGLVAGSGTKDWLKIDFLNQEVEFSVGNRLTKAKGGHSYVNPFRLLPWLAKHCSKRGTGLHAGDIVTTGAWTGLQIAKPGDEVVAKFPGIGEARLQIA